MKTTAINRLRQHQKEAARWAKEHSAATRNIIAIDGEGISDDEQSLDLFGEEIGAYHRYTLLAASTGAYIESHDLGTAECFNFLLSLSPKALIVGFSINYDINMMLKDVSYPKLVQLHEEGSTVWNGYHITYIPSKQFILKHEGKECTVWDVFGYFQCSFVKALEEWKVGDNETVSAISAMKDKRGTFDDTEAGNIREYCFTECKLLVSLVRELLQTLQDTHINVKRYDGAGSIAAAVMGAKGVRNYLREPNPATQHIAMLAYYGGRFEIAQTGIFNQTIHSYDIRSAYPHRLRQLPCLTHAVYDKTDTFESSKFGIWHVEWDIKGNAPWPPFPWRQRDLTVIYPLNGRGWYHTAEVEAALALYPKEVRVLGGIVLTPQCEHRPFAWIESMYAYRNKLKAEGKKAEKSIKLGLNSGYGKVAQGIGYHGKKPPFQSFVWAGAITAGCRAQLLHAIRQSPASILSVATDGILATCELDLPVGKELGEWEHKLVRNLFLAQPGVYRYYSDCDNCTELHGCREHQRSFETIRTRGFNWKELSFDALAELYQHDPMGTYTFSCVRFNGLGASLMRNPPLLGWRQWTRHPKSVSFSPAKRFILPGSARNIHAAPRLKGMPESAGYKPKDRWSSQEIAREGLDPEVVEWMQEMDSLH